MVPQAAADCGAPSTWLLGERGGSALHFDHFDFLSYKTTHINGKIEKFVT